MRRLPLLVVALVLAGCGGSSHRAATTTAPPKPPGKVVYQGTAWAVTLHGSKATAYHLAGGAWHADRSGDPKLDILGPKPGATAAATPQVAFEATGKTDLVDSAMWVDGVEVVGKGGGLKPTQGTLYGAPGKPLRPGMHVVVAFARTAAHANAVAWTFRV
jgi:hypothetical protein